VLTLLVIVDLKVGRFGYADAGQVNLYLNYAKEHWMKPGENPRVGLILCTERELRKRNTRSTISQTRFSPLNIGPYCPL